MAVKIIRRVPDELPYARLYLDDVEEISLILMDACKSKPEDSTQQPTITYALGNLRMDSIQDLRERGGSTSDLTIRVNGRKSAEVRFFRSLRPTLRANLWDDQEEWGVYSRIKTIFDARRVVFTNAIDDLPEPVKMILFFLLFGLPIVIALAWKWSAKSALVIIGGYYFLAVLIGFSLHRDSRVFLVDSNERTKVRAEARRGYVRDIAMLILGVLITKFGELLFTKFFK
jgi:hypothetical protein